MFKKLGVVIALSLGLASTAHADLIDNAGFESEWTGAASDSGNYAYGPTGDDMSWLFSGGAGVAETGSAWGGIAPEGNQHAFLQAANSSFYQSFVLATRSDLILSFSWAARPSGASNYNQRVQITVDDVELDLFHADTPVWASRSVDLGTFSAGTYTLKFSGVSGQYGDTSAFIDEVNLNATPNASPVPVPATFMLTLMGMGLFGLRKKQKENR